MSYLVILTSIRENSPVLVEAIYESKNAFTAAFNTDIFRSGRNFILPMFFLLDVIVLYWRLIRRYHQMQLRHIISELLSQKATKIIIHFELRGLSRIVSNINSLVDSTVIERWTADRAIKRWADHQCQSWHSNTIDFDHRLLNDRRSTIPFGRRIAEIYSYGVCQSQTNEIPRGWFVWIHNASA